MQPSISAAPIDRQDVLRRRADKPLKRALLIANQKSRNAAANLWQAIALLRQHGLELDECHPESPGQISELIHQRRDQVDLVILGGGDGTMNAGAQALAETGLPLGILPLGTANDLARTLGIPQNLHEACMVIANGRLRPVDLGWVNGFYFFNVANIGLGVRVATHLSGEIKKRWGVLAYLRGVVKAIKEHQPFAAKIQCDGQSATIRTIQIAVGNGRHYGGGMTIAAGAEIDDGLLHLYAVKPVSWWRLIGIAVALRRGLERPAVERFAGKEIAIYTRKPMRVSADGEMATRTPAHFKIMPGAIQVCVPA
jgi:diacylglycerol kinase (ATP)